MKVTRLGLKIIVIPGEPSHAGVKYQGTVTAKPDGYRANARKQ
jgi:hypothetical protein